MPDKKSIMEDTDAIWENIQRLRREKDNSSSTTTEDKVPVDDSDMYDPFCCGFIDNHFNKLDRDIYSDHNYTDEELEIMDIMASANALIFKLNYMPAIGELADLSKRHD